MKTEDKLEKKVYQLLGSIFSCISSCYFMVQFALNGIEGITNNIRLFSSFSVLFGVVITIASLIMYIRKQFV